MSRSVAEWVHTEGFLNMDENRELHETQGENSNLYMNIGRSSFGAVATSGKNKVIQFWLHLLTQYANDFTLIIPCHPRILPQGPPIGILVNIIFNIYNNV